MKRLLMCTAFAATTSFAALAQTPPATTPVEKSMDSATPDMKAPSNSNNLPSNKTVDDAVPAMKPAVALPSKTTATAPSPIGKGLRLTEAEAKNWIGKVIYSSDDKNVGEVADFVRDADGNVTEMHADVGGLLGIGETRVRVMPDQFTAGGDRISLSVTEKEAGNLPKVDTTAK
jgi:PRC-barrel domain